MSSVIPDSSLASKSPPKTEEEKINKVREAIDRKAAQKASDKEIEKKNAKKAVDAINKYFFSQNPINDTNIKVVKYVEDRQTLTIHYPTFDLTNETEKQSFITKFSNFCKIIITKENEYPRSANECSIVVSICIVFYQLTEDVPPKQEVTKAKNLTSSVVKKMSEIIYDDCLKDDLKYKDVKDDVNSPKRGERLQIAMDGAFLLFFLNPKGSLPKRSFAPTGHGGRNAFLHFKNKISNDEFLCGGIMSRNRAKHQGEGVFNCFGGSPDYDENIQITIIREMLEEMFETLFRDPKVIKPEAEQTEDYKKAIKLLKEILGQEQTIDPLDQFVSNLHTNCDLQLEERFKQVVLTERFNKINWNGLGYPDHPLSTGERVLSLTTYYLPNQKIETEFSAEEVAEIVMTNYAKTELNGVFVLKITPNYKTFFTAFDSVLTGPMEPMETMETFQEKINKILTSANEETIDFLLVSYNGELYNNFTFSVSIELYKENIEKDENEMSEKIVTTYTLLVKIHHTKPEFDIIFLKIVLNDQFKPDIKLLNNPGITPFYMNDGGSETYYVLKYINDINDINDKPPL
jgi:hypothetical protein